MTSQENKGYCLIEETRRLLINRPASLEMQQIANDTEISASWLYQFARGKIENAGCLTVGSLNKYLSERQSAK